MHVHGVKVTASNCMPICIPILRNFILSLTLMKKVHGYLLMQGQGYFSQIFKTIECQILLSYFKAIEPQMAY